MPRPISETDQTVSRHLPRLRGEAERIVHHSPCFQRFISQQYLYVFLGAIHFLCSLESSQKSSPEVDLWSRRGFKPPKTSLTLSSRLRIYADSEICEGTRRSSDHFGHSKQFTSMKPRNKSWSPTLRTTSILPLGDSTLHGAFLIEEGTFCTARQGQARLLFHSHSPVTLVSSFTYVISQVSARIPSK